MSDRVQDLRNLRVLVAHPRDQSAAELMQQLNRIGCKFNHTWPLPALLLETVDLVFLDLTDQSSEKLKSFVASSPRQPSLVAVLGYENPLVLDIVFEIGAHAVLNKPIRASGVLSSMLMAQRFQQEQARFSKDLRRLSDKLESVQKVSDAKFILMRHHSITEHEAYDMIRRQAMAKRTTTAEIAQSIINAESILSNLGGA